MPRSLRPLLALPLAALSAALLACGGGGADATGTTPPGGAAAALTSFERIQRTILTPQCAGCHAAGRPDAAQSGLVLEAGAAYESLVGARPTNANARADGLLRVMPGKPDSSLLIHKLAWTPGHHARDYGLPMPSGTTAGISEGQLEYVRRWIAAGAPRTGDALDAALLADRSPQRMPPFAPLAAPARGVQLRVDSFAVRGNFERELFVWRPLRNASDLFVSRIETRMRPGSHHLVLYSYDETRSPFCALRPAADVVRDIRNLDGTMNVLNMLPMACHVFVGGAMTQDGSYEFPAGVALRLPAGTGLDFNVHYVNRTPAEFPGEAYANLHTVDAASVRHVARTLNLGNSNIELPPGRRTTLTREFAVTDSSWTIVALTSHMHARGERFVIRVRGGAHDGRVLYESVDWEHPTMTTFTPALVLRRGDRLVSEVTYDNTTARTIRFGLTSEDEMGIIFGYYY